MCLLDPVLTGVTLGVLLLAGWVVRTVMVRVNEAGTAAQESVGLVGAALERALGALRTVKASGAEDRAEAAVHAAAESSWRAGVRAAKWLALAGNTAELAVQTAFFTVLAIGGSRVASGALDVGRLIAFLMYLFYLVPAVQQLVGRVSQYHLGAAAVNRIRETEALGAEPDGPDTRPGARRLPRTGLAGVPGRALPVRSRTAARAPGGELLGAVPGNDGLRRTVRGGQDHPLLAPGTLLRDLGRQHPPRRAPTGQLGPGRTALPHRLRGAGRARRVRIPARQPAARPARRDRPRAGPGAAHGPPRRTGGAPTGRPRHAGGAPRHPALRRPAAAGGDRPRAAAPPPAAAPGRGDLAAGRGERGRAAGHRRRRLAGRPS
ncbi:hypothetical protein STANM309S_02656 [Streptomyces tanashiensis]